MRKKLSWSFIANEVYSSARDYCSCEYYHTPWKQQRQLKPFFSKGPLEYIRIDVSGLLPETKPVSQFGVVTTYHYTELTKAILTTELNATTMALTSLEHLMANYGIPSKLLNNNGPQIVAKFFVALCSTLRVIIVTITGCLPYISAQAERFSSTIISWHRRCVSKR